MNILQPPTKARKFQEVAQYLQDIGLSASSATVRECVTELERKDAEIARLKDELARSSHLEATSDEWHGMWDVANERANKAEAEAAKWRNAHKSRVKCPNGHSPRESRGPCWYCDAERNASEVERLRAHVERLQESDDAIGTIHAICADAGLVEGHAVERVRALAADLAALRAAVIDDGADYRVDAVTVAAIQRRQADAYDIVLAQRDDLRAAVLALPEYKHSAFCAKYAGYGIDRCTCGADAANAARAAALELCK